VFISSVNGLKVVADASPNPNIELGDTAAIGATAGAVTVKLLVYFATPL